MELDRNLIEQVLPAESGDANWDDVLRRADHARRRTTRRTGVLVVLAALVVGVTSAFGGRIVHLFQGEPAPPSVQRSARDMIPPDPIEAVMGRQSTQVVAGETHGLIRLDTENGPFFLWGAPTTNGGRCVILTVGSLEADPPVSTGQCLLDTRDREFAVSNDIGLLGIGDTLVEFGLVPRGAASVELHTRAGETVPVQPVESAFLVQLPWGTKLREIVARDAAGAVIARQSLVFHRPRGCCPKIPVPPDAAYKTLFAVKTSIGVVTLKTAVGYPGCYEVDMPVVDGHSSGAGTCASPAQPLPTPLQLGLTPLNGDINGPFLIDGATRENVKRLELRFDDGSVMPLPLHERYFMAELPRGKHPTVFAMTLADGSVKTQPFDGRDSPSKLRP